MHILTFLSAAGWCGSSELKGKANSGDEKGSLELHVESALGVE